MLSHTQKFGLKHEEAVAKILAKFGEVEHLSKENWLAEFDLQLEDRLFHCKAATSKRHRAHGTCWRNRYQFNLSMITGGDFVICRCVTWGQPVHFIIPVAELTKRGLYITSHPLVYNGWAAQYRENWQLLQSPTTDFSQEN